VVATDVKKKPWTEKYALGFLILVGLVHGLLYVFSVPPWQHYDEPTQFEYAWLVANRASWPQPGDFDPEMRREVAASMAEHNFFKQDGANLYPNLLTGPDEPVWLGVSQLGDRPLYYFLASIPLRLLKYSDVTMQLYAARLVSLALFLITLFFAWGAMGELIADPAHPLRWMVPFSIALLPGFVDLMTAVNNDVAAAAFFTLFLWGCIRLIKYGLKPLNIGWVLVAAALCVYTKSTVYVAVPLAVLALTFGALRGQRRKLAWILLALMSVGAIALTFTWGESPADFYALNTPYNPTRVQNTQAPAGKYAFELKITQQNVYALVQQPITPAILRSLAGKEVTVGGWFWSNHPEKIYLPQVIISNNRIGQPVSVEITEKPQFFAYSVQMPSNPEQGWFRVIPTPQELSGQTSIFIDGLTFVEGNFSPADPPVFSDIRGVSGTWYNQKFQNLLYNGSAEAGWPGLRRWAANFLAKYYPGGSAYLFAVLDWKWSIPYFEGDLGVLFRTFWARFGWGNVPLAGKRPYLILLIITIASLCGSAIFIWRNRRKIDLALFGLGVIVLASIWGITLVRGIGSVFVRTLYPVARYAYPSILPAMLLLNIGWFAGSEPAIRYTHLPRKALTASFFLLFIGFDVFALWSLQHFYA
jgi:hypothetical protein